MEGFVRLHKGFYRGCHDFGWEFEGLTTRLYIGLYKLILTRTNRVSEESLSGFITGCWLCVLIAFGV